MVVLILPILLLLGDMALPRSRVGLVLRILLR
jgi:hypothetical protein